MKLIIIESDLSYLYLKLIFLIEICHKYNYLISKKIESNFHINKINSSNSFNNLFINYYLSYIVKPIIVI